MTQKEFLQKVREAYLSAREYKYIPNSNQQVLSRGTSHSISSETEDLFGCYCAEKVINEKEIKIIIDPPISFKGTNLKNKSGKKSLLMRPDILITKDGIANCLFDLKTDLGYKRFELLNQAKEKNELLKLIKGHNAKYKDGKTKQEIEIKFSNEIKFVYVVISQGNIKIEKLNEYIRGIKELENIEIYVLSTGDHLNSYNQHSNWNVNETDFNELDNLINKKMKE